METEGRAGRLLGRVMCSLRQFAESLGDFFFSFSKPLKLRLATHKQRSSRERKASGWLYRLWSSRLAGFTTWRFEFLVFLYPITRDNWRPEGRLLTLCSVSPSPLARPYAGSSEAWWRVDHCLQGGKGRKPGFPSNRPNSSCIPGIICGPGHLPPMLPPNPRVFTPASHTFFLFFLVGGHSRLWETD